MSDLSDKVIGYSLKGLGIASLLAGIGILVKDPSNTTGYGGVVASSIVYKMGCDRLNRQYPGTSPGRRTYTSGR